MLIFVALSAGVIFAAMGFALFAPKLLTTLQPSPSSDEDNFLSLTKSKDAALPCIDAIIQTNSSGTFYTCQHSNPIPNTVFSLPPPTYKKAPCTSTYGCAYRYGYVEIVPPNLLTQPQRQQVLNTVLDLPHVKEETSANWTVDRFDIQSMGDKWYGHVTLLLVVKGIKRPADGGGCGWYGTATLNLETLKVVNVNIPTLPPTTTMSQSEKCTTDVNPEAKNFVMP